jgi:predicted phage tail protein
MDEEQVKQMIADLRTELTDQIHTANQGLASNLTKQIAKIVPIKSEDKKPEPESSDNPLSMKALQQQIAELTKDIESERAAAFAAASDSALSQIVATSGTTSPAILKKLLATDYQGRLKQEGSVWFVVDGETATPLKQAVDSYLASDDGKFFLPPSGTKGSGATETKPVPAATGSQSLSQQLEAAFKVAK